MKGTWSFYCKMHYAFTDIYLFACLFSDINIQSMLFAKTGPWSKFKLY